MTNIKGNTNNMPNLSPGKPTKSRVTISAKTYEKMKKKTLRKR